MMVPGFHMLLYALLLTGVTLGLAAQEPATPDPWMVKPSPKVVEAVSYADPAGRFTLEYPRKDWRIVPGAYTTLLTLNHKDTEATVTIERQELVRPLSPSAIGDLFVQLQTAEILKLDPLARDVKQKIIELPPRRVPAFEYVRRPAGGKDGAKGEEYMRIYLVPHGPFLYRVVCRSDAARLPKHAPVFALVASSLRFKEGN